MRPHLKHGPGLAGAQFRHAKTGVKKAGIMRAEFTDPGIIGTHFSGVIARHSDKFPTCQNIKFIRIKHQTTRRQIGRGNTFPKRINRTACRRVNIDQASMLAGPPADHTAFIIGLQIDRQPHPITNIDVGRSCTAQQTDICVQRLHGIIGDS